MKRVGLLVVGLLCFVIVFAQQPKYIFYIIGDGMGVNAVTLTEMYLAEIQGRIGTEPLRMTQFPYTGHLRNFSASNSITDSSAAGTCLASGKKTNNYMEGVTPDGQPAVSVAEKLKQDGWGIGVATSVSIDHATPGAFYAHVNNRDDYYHIGQQLAYSNYDFFGGSSFCAPNNKKNTNDPNLYDLAEQEGYVFARGFADFLTKKDAPKMILIQPTEGLSKNTKSKSCLPRSYSRDENALTLAQLMKAGIINLARNDKFFFMVEAGAIDWAAHSHDGGSLIDDMLEMDKAVQVAYEFYLQHPDETLIVITADHETGGLSLGNGTYTLNLKLLQNQKVSSGMLNVHIRDLFAQYGKKLKWEQVKQVLTEDFGFYAGVDITPEEDATLKSQFTTMKKGKGKSVKTLYGEISQLSNTALAMLNKKAELAWTTPSHTASPVPVFAIGVGAERFAGWHDNSEVAPALYKLATGKDE